MSMTRTIVGIYVEDNNPFRYCAEYYDSETEFIYLRARYYSPDLQRFISEDPIRFAENWYAYCGNMPIIYVDKTGANLNVLIYDFVLFVIDKFNLKKYPRLGESYHFGKRTI